MCRREIVGLHIGPSEAEVFWSDFLKSLKVRGLTGIKLVISDAHEGLKAAIVRVLGATWQRCRVHWTRNALAYVPKGQHTMVAAALRQAFQQPDDAARTDRGHGRAEHWPERQSPARSYTTSRMTHGHLNHTRISTTLTDVI
jgi:putative transposase